MEKDRNDLGGGRGTEEKEGRREDGQSDKRTRAVAIVNPMEF